jgi:hypothetical protein
MFWAGRWSPTLLISHLKRLEIVMKNFNDSYFSSEQYDFKPFSEEDLAMVMGGGGDEQPAGLWPLEIPGDDDIDDLAN